MKFVFKIFIFSLQFQAFNWFGFIEATSYGFWDLIFFFTILVLPFNIINTADGK